MKKLILLLAVAGLFGFNSCNKCLNCRTVNADKTTGKFLGADPGTQRYCTDIDGQLAGEGVVNIDGVAHATNKYWQCTNQ